ncbi:uncharacterized protein LOC107016703 [Solanum pennellii]|uniref:Uncharacterized protein LOC107016703 n=1 Tax=Solanum pennellii TaxID=28526 RepID=A0ABM1GKY8_SOLPN|nr:uncharacterized protein LOC107016703 [Solanum pennellii]
MSTRRNAGRRVEEALAGGNQDPPQVPAVGEQVPVNPIALTNGEVRTTLVQMGQAITIQAHAITSQTTRESAPWENLHASTMASRQRDFTRMNPSVYFRSRTNEDPQEFVEEVHKILCAMGVNEDEKADLASYQLKDVDQRGSDEQVCDGVSEDTEEEYRSFMLHDNMDLARLTVHAQQVEKSRRMKRGRVGKKRSPSDQASSRTVRRGKSGPKKSNDRIAQRDNKPCGKCGRLHGGECLVGSNACYGCSKSGHIIRDWPHMRNQAKADNQPRPNPAAAVEPLKRNMFYPLKGREEQEKSADVVTVSNPTGDTIRAEEYIEIAQ